LIGAQGLEERRSIETTGAQQRATQSELLAGQERQIGLTGREERLGIQTSGLEQRATQSQLLAGQERQIGLTGARGQLQVPRNALLNASALLEKPDLLGFAVKKIVVVLKPPT
jgi:hypothetical protein